MSPPRILCAYVSGLLLFLALSSYSKVFERCELARVLLEKHNIPYSELGDWVCVASWASSFNSSRYKILSTNSTENGLFVLSSRWHCSDEFHPHPNTSSCSVPCSRLRGEDLTDVVRCVQLIVARNGSLAPWWHYRYFCKGRNNTAYLAGCPLDGTLHATAHWVIAESSKLFLITLAILGAVLCLLVFVLARRCKRWGSGPCLVAQYKLVPQDVILNSSPEKVLGEGHFAVVRPGRYRNEEVAFKTVKDGVDPVVLQDELKVLAHLHHLPHPHVIGMFGVHLDPAGTLYLVVEQCPLGNLHKYLTEHGSLRPEDLLTGIQNNEILKEGKYTPTRDRFVGNETLSPGLMLTWSLQLADAMEYLSARKVIHGDLAARNVLLKERTVVKLTDFGLSRKLYGDVNYMRTNGKEVAWRWLPPEALTARCYSTASDVWSFGVTLWEIYSFAQEPLAEIPNVTKYLQKLEEHRIKGYGFILGKPEVAPDDMYTIMKRCWSFDHKMRPRFTELRTELWRYLAATAVPEGTFLETQVSRF